MMVFKSASLDARRPEAFMLPVLYFWIIMIDTHIASPLVEEKCHRRSRLKYQTLASPVRHQSNYYQ